MGNEFVGEGSLLYILLLTTLCSPGCMQPRHRQMPSLTPMWLYMFWRSAFGAHHLDADDHNVVLLYALGLEKESNRDISDGTARAERTNIVLHAKFRSVTR